MLFCKEHGNLTYLHDFSFARFSVDCRFFYLIMTAYFGDNVLDGNRFAFATNRFANNSFCQIDVHVTLKNNGLCQQRVDDTFQFTYAFVDVFGNVVYYRFRNIQPSRRILLRRIFFLSSTSGFSSSATKPHLKRVRRRSSIPCSITGARSEVRISCLPFWCRWLKIWKKVF